MKHLILAFFVALFSFAFDLPEAEARRLGGGGSSGMQRQMTPQAPRPPVAAPRQNSAGQQAVPPTQGKRSWMGPVAGLAAGLGLAALASHLGFGEEMASFMLMALLAVAAIAVFRLLSRRRGVENGATLRYAGAGAATGSGSPFPVPASEAPRATSAASVSGATLADFDAEAFVRQAKVNFIRLQAANDAGNLDDIREFTTPEMFAEIRMQLVERGPVPQQTDVVDIDASVMDVAEEAGRYIVSVRFCGLVREEADAAPGAIDEVWHLTKPVSGSEGWRIAGIQQMN